MTFFDRNKQQPNQPNQPNIPTPDIKLNGEEGRIKDKNGDEREVKIPKLSWA